MDVESIRILAVAIIAASPGVLAYRASRKAQTKTEQLESKKVDQEAYALAHKFFTETLGHYKAELERARGDNAFLQMRIGELEITVRKLRRAMELADLPLPEEPHGN